MVYAEPAPLRGLRRHRPAPGNRNRLLHALDRASAAALTIVRGHGGSGKTALLADWAQARDGSCAWLALAPLASEEQGDARQLTRWMLDALAAASPPEEAALFGRAGAEAASGRALSASLALPPHLRSPRFLLIDDLHLIREDQTFPILELLRALPGLHIVASTAVLSPLEHGRAFHELETALIGPCELALTEAETAGALLGSPLAASFRSVRAAAAGSARWVRYLAIKAADLSGDFPGWEEFLDLAARDLADHIVPPCPGDQQRFRLGIAVPESISVELAEQLCPGAPAESLLRGAELDGLLTRSADGEAVLVPLVRRSLLAVLAGQPARTRRNLERGCAVHYLASGQPPAALRHAVGAEDPTLVAEILHSRGIELLQRHPAGTRRELERMPLPLLVQEPAPALALGALYMTDPLRRSRGLELCAAAVAAARRARGSIPPPPAAERFLLAAVEAVGLRLRGGLGKARRRAREGLDLYLQMPLAERERIGPLEAPAVAQLGITLGRGADRHGAAEALKRAGVLSSASDAQHAGFYWALVAWLQASAGDVRSAERHLLESCVNGWPESAADSYSATPYRLAQARIALEHLDIAAARDALAPLLAAANANEFWPYVRCCNALVELLAGDASAALAQLESLEPRRRDLPPIGKFEHTSLARMRALLLLAVGRPAQALKLLERLPATEPETALLTARIRIACAQPQEALSALARFDEDPDRAPAVQVQLAGLSAAGKAQLGDTEGAVLDLARFAALQERFGLGLSTALLPRPDLSRLSAAASDAGIDVALPVGFHGVIAGCAPVAVLTPREEAVLQALVSTGSVAEIAGMGFVSTNTVKSQLRSLYRKLGVANRDQALAEGRSRGLI